MKRLTLPVLVILLMLAVNAHALDTADLLEDSDTKSLLGKKCIRTETSGMVPISYATATEILSKDGLCKTIQEEYARSVSKTGEVDLPIIETSPGHYYYLNEDDQRTDIVELYRKQTQPGVFDVVMKASGKRFFGSFDVIVHVQVVDTTDKSVLYLAEINAYPHNGPVRFIARKLGLVEHYFKKHTDDMQWVAKQITTGLASRIGFKSSTTADAPHPFLPVYSAQPELIQSDHSSKSGA